MDKLTNTIRLLNDKNRYKFVKFITTAFHGNVDDTIIERWENCILDNDDSYSHNYFYNEIKHDINILRELGKMFVSQNNNDYGNIIKGIESTIALRARSEYGLYVIGIRAYNPSKSFRGRSIGYRIELSNKTLVTKVYTLKELKKMYLPDDDIYHDIVVTGKVHFHQLARGSFDTDKFIYVTFIERVKFHLKWMDYLSVKELKIIRQLVIDELGLKRALFRKKFTKDICVSLLIKENIITGDTKRKLIDGKQIWIYE